MAKRRCAQGVIVESVNVSALPYVPVRSGSVDAIDCLKLSVPVLPKAPPVGAELTDITGLVCGVVLVAAFVCASTKRSGPRRS
jgi:hypothetical protein